MKIVDIRLAMLSVPLVTPFKTALRTVDRINDIVVMIETDCGAIGYGSAPATPVITGDTHGSIIAAIKDVIKPRLFGANIIELNQLLHVVSTALVGNYSAKAAIEIAIYDLWAQALNMPLYQALGGHINHLKTDITISVDNIEKMVSDAKLALHNGFDVLKIKVGDDIEKDIERVKAIDNLVNGQACLRLDVNQGWTAKDTVYALRHLEDIGVKLELIEQPVSANDNVGLKYISDRVNTPVMADESAFGPRQVIELLNTHSADIINIKLMKTGGISNAIKIADIAQLYDVPCMMGCMLEGSVGAAAAAHVAAAKSISISKIDLDGPVLGLYDPVIGGVKFDGSNISLNATPGLGIERIDGLIAIS